MRPLVSIIIATFNSESLLPLVLRSIRGQNFPRSKLEILVIDGGSKDKTLYIAKKFECKIINNPRVEPVYGKYLGYLKAKGKYLMYVDHDEVLLNIKSITNRVAALQSAQFANAVAGGGYVNPKGYPFINDYINEFGDPFSFFIYRLSKKNGFFLPTMKRRYSVVRENKDYALFDLSGLKNPPIIELVAGGSMFNADILKREFPETKEDVNLLPHFFYLLYSKYPYIFVMKKDKILHYSANTLGAYLRKISWRVENNIYHIDDMGQSGYSGRQKYQTNFYRFKKYLFIPYTFTLLFLIYDTVWLIITRRNINYIFHIPLSIYTASLILLNYLFKSLGVKKTLKNYDNSKIVAK